ncbi:hypothetical protein ACOMHN_057375 [Nucella lapillus]
MQASDSKEEKKGQKTSQEIRELICKEEYLLKKRLPARLPRRRNDVYVSRKTNFASQLQRSEKIINTEEEVFIHGLGSAVNRAINLALQLKERGLGTLEVDVKTSTVELIDDLEPETDDLEHDTRTRQNSAVHIRVFRLEHDTVPDAETK